MTRVGISRLVVAVGSAALSVVLLATSAMAADGTGMGSGGTGGHMTTPSGGTVAGNSSTATGSATMMGNTAPQSPGAAMGDAGAVMAQGGIPSASPTFMLGFGAMAGMMGDLAGQPTEDEWHGANGDGLQRTTRGMMVWRKTDNWTAFTNGYMTWVNGPYGVQMRLNTERFPWEAQ